MRVFASFWPRVRHLGMDPIGGEEARNRLERIEWAIYDRRWQYPKFAIEWRGRYSEMPIMLLAWLRLSYYFKYVLDLA